jgi:hypothetical protein
MAPDRGKRLVRASNGGRPYASIPASQVGTQRVRRLSGCAVRVLLLGHAARTPKGAAPMPIAFIASELQISKLNAAAAVRSLLPDLLTLRSPAVRPRGMGAAGRGAAAVYNVAGRLPGAAHRVFEPGDRRHQGSFRIGCDDLRILAAMMTNGEARVLVCLVLPCDRDKHGVPQRAQPIALTGRATASVLPGMSARAADAAISGLVGKSLLRQIAPASGRRAAMFEVIGLAASGVRRGSRGGTDAAHHMHGYYKGVTKLRTNSPAIVSTRVTLTAATVSGDVVRRFETVDPSLCAESEPGNKQRVGNDVLLSMVDIALLRRLVNAPVVRDRGVPNGIDYGAMTRLLELRLVDTGRLPDECGRMRRRCYRITAAGRVALEKNARAA